MKTQLETLLARLTILMLLLTFLVIGGKVFAQDRFLLTLGSSFSDAQSLLAKYPQLKQSGIEGHTLRMANPYLAAEYQFEGGKLNSLKVTRDFENHKLAFASMEGHLITLERAGATVYPVLMDKHTSMYVAMTETASYEITLHNAGKYNSLEIKSWKRAAEDTEFTAMGMGGYQFEKALCKDLRAF